MGILRRILILTHRYLGIALSLLVVVWFASGIVMMYAGGMPRLLAGAAPRAAAAIDVVGVQLTPAEAAERAGLAEGPERASLLLTVMERPAYRFGGGRSATVFADNGEMLGDVSVEQSHDDRQPIRRICPKPTCSTVETLTQVDQWTLGQGAPDAAAQVPRRRRRRHRAVRVSRRPAT